MPPGRAENGSVMKNGIQDNVPRAVQACHELSLRDHTLNFGHGRQFNSALRQSSRHRLVIFPLCIAETTSVY